MCTAGLHRALCVANLLQHAAAVLQSLGKQILLLSNLRQQHTKLVADIAQGLVVGALAPLAELSSNGSALLGSLLISIDRVVFRFDELVELLGQLGLLVAA